MARACKSQAVNNGALGGVLGTAGSENVQGEVQKKLDIIAAWAATSVAPMIPRQVIILMWQGYANLQMMCVGFALAAESSA